MKTLITIAIIIALTLLIVVICWIIATYLIHDLNIKWPPEEDDYE